MKANVPSNNGTPAAKSRDYLYKKERFIKLAVVALHERFRFGHDRITDFLGALSEAADESEKMGTFWTHADDLIKQLGLEDAFQKKRSCSDRENYEKVDRKKLLPQSRSHPNYLAFSSLPLSLMFIPTSFKRSSSIVKVTSFSISPVFMFSKWKSTLSAPFCTV